MSRLGNKFEKYAIANLTLVLILCYVTGYVMGLINPRFMEFLYLNPYEIVHGGQLWRVITWLLVPPSRLDIFTVIMLWFYYSIGTLMERTLGTVRYNKYILGGVLYTVIASLLCMLMCSILYAAWGPDYVRSIFDNFSPVFSTYYINLSIFLAFATCYPEQKVLLMFVIPVKVKWLGYIDLIFMVIDFIGGNIVSRFAIGAALFNYFLFYLSVKNLVHLKPTEVKRRAEFKQKIRHNAPISKHKCAICGQTDEDNPDLEFRFCSKCNGNYQYCQNHLFTHEHVK